MFEKIKLLTKLDRERLLIYLNYIGIVFALSYGFFLRWKLYIANRSLWIDAASLANDVIHSSYADLFKPFADEQSAPSGFLIVTKFIGSFFNYNEYSLLFLPLLFGVASMALFTILSLQMLGRKAAYIAVIIFSLSSTVIYYSAEYKPYSADVFFAILLIYLVNITIKNNFSNRSFLALGLAGLLAIWFSFAALFIIAAISLAMFWSVYSDKKNKPYFKKTLLLLSAWLVYYVIIFFLVINRSVQPAMYVYHATGFAPFPIRSFKDIQWYIDTATLVFAHPLGMGRLFQLPLLCLCAGIIVFLKKTNRLTSIILFTPLLFLFMASLLKKYPILTGHNEINSRLILFIVPILCLCIAQGAWYFLQNKSLVIYTLFVMVLLNFSIFSNHNRYLKEETRPLVEYIQQKKLPGDSIYVYKAAIPAFRYYTRNAPMDYFAGNYHPTNPQGYVDEFSTLPHTGRYWLIFSHDFEAKEKILLTYLNSEAKKLDEKKTKGASLYLYSY